MLYLVIFLVLAIFSFFELNIERYTEYNIIYYTIAAFIIILAGIRYETGYDFITYKYIFDNANFSNYQEHLVEPGTAFLIVLIHALHLNFTAFLTLYALLGVTIKLRFFQKYAPYFFTAFLIYFPIGYLINEFGQIRHGLAVAIVLIAFGFLFKNKKKLFLLFVCIAILFHISAFIVLPAIFFVNKDVKSYLLAISIVFLSVFLFIDTRPFFLSILDIVPIPTIQAKMTLYLYSEEFGKPLGLNFSLILRFVIFFLLLYFKETGMQRFPYLKQITLLYYYGIILYIIFNSISEFAIRTSLYFKTLDCIILPCIISLGKTKKEKNILLVLVILYALYSLYKPLTDPFTRDNFIPYKTIFSKSN